MRTTRPVVLLALVALLTPCAEASRTRVWESNPPAAVFAKTDAGGQLAPLAPAARLDTGAARDAEIAEPQRFDLGGLVFIESELEHEDGFGLGPLELLGPTPLRGPPPSYPETRVGGFELLPPFRVGPSASLSLWSRQACGSTSCGLASDSPEDPWGLESSGAFGAIDRRDRGITNPIAGTIDPEAVAKEAVATAVEELSYVGVANGLSGALAGYDFVRKEKVEGFLPRVLAGLSALPAVPATVRHLADVPGVKALGKVGGVSSKEAAHAAGEITGLGRRIEEPIVVSSQEMQAVAKSVRRHVDKLNKSGARKAGQAFRVAVDAGDYQVAGAIAHNRMFKRLNSRDFRTLDGEKVLINRGRVYPPPGSEATRGYRYRMPDIQYGSPGAPSYRTWDFKGSKAGWPYPDPTGQFADVLDWTGVTPEALLYHWR